MLRHIKQILQVIILATAMLVSCSHVTVLGKATKCSITFYLVHIYYQIMNRVTRISAHTLDKSHILPRSNFESSSVFVVVVVFLHTALCKGNPEFSELELEISQDAKWVCGDEGSYLYLRL